MYRIIAAAAAALFLASPAVHAGATLHVGSGYGTSCQTGGCPLYGTEVNGISSSLDIYQNSGGAPALNDPVLLILGVPNTTINQLDAGALTQADLISGGTSTPIGFSFGSTDFGLSGFAGTMTSADTADVYSLLGLAGGNGSNKFSNWSSADSAVDGITAADFGIYVFSLFPEAANVAFAGQDFLDLTTSGVPKGTFAVAYGLDASGKNYSTPFTEAGLTTTTPPSVPEPMTLALMGVGLVGLGLARRKPAA